MKEEVFMKAVSPEIVTPEPVTHTMTILQPSGLEVYEITNQDMNKGFQQRWQFELEVCRMPTGPSPTLHERV